MNPALAVAAVSCLINLIGLFVIHGKVVSRFVAMETKLDLLLNGQLKVKKFETG